MISQKGENLMIPDERTCRYFLIIAQEKNISHAARQLYISQPSLSRFLSGLERELGTELFLREAGTLSLTAAGEQFFRYITKLKELEASFSAEVSLQEDPKPPQYISSIQGMYHHLPAR